MLVNVTRRRVCLPGEKVEIALLDWGGEGPLALLHHANGFCAGLWGLVAESLRGQFRIVAMDARGHGDSSRPEGAGAYDWSVLADDLVFVAEMLLAENGRGNIALGLGHSFGGTLTLTAAARRPGIFERIVLVDPVILPPMEGVPPEQRGRGSEMAKRARKRRHIWEDRVEARAFFAERELFAEWDPRALDLYVREGLRERDDGRVELKCPGKVEAAIFDQNQSLDLFAEVTGVRAPARFLWAKRGNFPISVYQDLAERLDQASVEVVDAGHLMPMEQPERVAEAVLRFAADPDEKASRR